MNPAQARQLIKDTFTQPFDRDRFGKFAANLLNHVDGEKKGAMAVPDAFAAHVKSCRRLAGYSDPRGELLDVLIVNVSEDYKIERTRTALRDFVAHKLKRGDNYKEAALVAFVPPDARRWRLSYVRMQYVTVRDPKTGVIKPEERPTPARRFSYLVGEGESCHTAQTRFLNLLQDTATDPTLAQIEEAFSVEAVSDEFFKKYRSLFEDTLAALEKLVAKDKTLRDEFKAKGVNTVDFAKKLMGQIVFLYFLQKKGWMGVEKGQDWGTGLRGFLRRLADRSDRSDQSNLFNDVFEPLFYDTLATDRGHDAWCNRFNCRIPFLNGGLFEPLADYNWKKTDVLLPNRLFTNDDPVEEGITGTGVLDVFDRYNFTVNEAEPLEKEVAIDPEMLGKVFENLIEENRRKGLGAFYTPREIVHYMCQESLINYLDTAVNCRAETIGREERKQAKFGDAKAEQTLLTTSVREEIVPRSDIGTFVRLGEQISHYEAVDAEYKIKMPKSIDKNAKALDDALRSITVCDPAVGSGAFPVGMMTEIVRARAALNPYFHSPDPSNPSDAPDRTPYHFKRHAIQNCLYGVDIDSSAVDIAKLRLWLSLVVDEEDVKQVKPLPNLDYKIVVGNSLLGVEKNLFNHEAFRRLEALKPRFFDQTDPTEKTALRRQINETIHELTNGNETFDFEIFFSEVFRAKKGFDVVIANPPYIPIEAMTHQDRGRFQARFSQLQRKFDSAAVFILVCLEILSKKGNLTFISSITWQTGENYSDLRRHLFTTAGVHTLVNLPFDVFEAAYVDTGIYILSKQPTISYRICLLAKKAVLAELQNPRYAEVEIDLVQPPRYKLVLNPTAALLLNRFRKRSNITTLGAVTESTQGLAASAYLQSGNAVAGHHLPFAPKAQMRRYHLELNETNYTDMSEHKSLVRFYGARPKLLIRRIINRQDRLDATYTERPAVFKKDINPFVVSNDHCNPLYLLAMVNSRFISWLYVNTSSIATKDDFRQTTLAELRELPIPIAPLDAQNSVGALVNRILAAKKADPTADTTALEHKIDQIVYRLYDLTPDEIAQIEGALVNTRRAGGKDDDVEEDANQ